MPGALVPFLVLQRRRGTETNTHRQHVRIVQSHHRILCNNSNCRRSSLLSSSRAASPSLPLCHLTSSVSLVCLTDSKSPSLCPRSLRLPCQSPSSSSTSSAGLCPCHSPSRAFFCIPPLFPLLSSPTHSFLFFASPTRSLLSFYPQPSFSLLCPCLLISSVSSPVLLLCSSLTQKA